MNCYYGWAKEMCDLIDEFAKCHISTDTPMFDFQQSIISHCRTYREMKAQDQKHLEEMWKNPENCWSSIPKYLLDDEKEVKE